MNKNWGFPKALLFDLDGVLIDSEPLHGKAWKETASFFGLDLTYSQIKLLRGRRRIDCANELINLIQKPVRIEDLLKIHKPISRELILSAHAMPGSESLIKWCYENNIPLALVTSSSSESFQIKSAPHSWMRLFSTKVLGDDKSLSKGKPAPDPYLLAAEKLNVEANECWAVEDSISGTSSALQAGCCVFLLKEKNDESLIDKLTNTNNKLKEIIQLKEIKQILENYSTNRDD